MAEICMVNHHAEVIGGGELSMLQLMDGLKAGGRRVSLALPEAGDLARRAAAGGHMVRLLPMPPIGLRSLPAILRWHRLLRRDRPALLHAHTPRAAFYAGVAGRLLGIPAIFHCRVAERDLRLDPVLVRLMTHLLCNSEATARRFARWPKRIPKVIYNGLDVAVRPLMRDAENGKTLLFVGRLSREKQPQLLWQAFQRLAAKHAGLQLCFVGGDDPVDPQFADRLRHEVQASQLGWRVHWAGWQQDVGPWYEGAELVVVPSRHEGFGRVLVEAMAHGVPVVAFRTGAIPEVVEDGVQGLLVEPGDMDGLCEAIEQLLRDRTAHARMVAAGPARATRFTLQHHVSEMAKFYREIFAERTGGSSLRRKAGGIWLMLRRLLLASLATGRRIAPPEAGEVRNILVIRRDRLGDVVLTAALLPALRSLYPDAAIDMRVQESMIPLFERHPDIRHAFAGPPVAGGYDLVIDPLLDYPLRPAREAAAVGGRWTLGFDVAGRGAFFTIPVMPPTADEPFLASLALLLRPLGFAGEVASPQLPVSDAERSAARLMVGQHQFVAIHPGAFYASQRWPAASFAAAADALLEEGVGVALVGAEADRPVLDQIGNAMRRRDAASYICGEPLRTVMAVLAEASVVLCNNSGPLHLAGALGTPSVSTLGPTNPAIWWPVGERQVVLQAPGCDHCERGDCPRGCLARIDIESVLQAVRRLLEHEGPAGMA